jgi:hypothetical protein
VEERQNEDERSAAKTAARVLLPTIDPDAQARIADLLAEVAASGVDAATALRDGVNAWFGPRAAAALPIPTAVPTGRAPDCLTVEPLPPSPRPRLWPQRPKRRPGELFSSWLWQAAIAAGVPPRRFVKDVAGGPYDDIDRDLAPATLTRLANASGQSVRSLGAGLVVPGEAVSDHAEQAENLLLADGRFLVGRRGRGRQGRPLPVLQYCPRCLQSPDGPRFARAWRLAPFAVCLAHACRLHDGCWRCAAPVALLDQRTADPVPRCGACDAAFLDAPETPDIGARSRLRALTALLRYAGGSILPEERDMHLATLASVFPEPTLPVARRVRALRGLRASNWPDWFGAPVRDLHAENLRLLARGVVLERLHQLKAARLQTARIARLARAPDGAAPDGAEIEIEPNRRPAARRRAG